MKRVFRFYQIFLRPFVGTCCRFYPSCSDYAIEAVEKHGNLKGTWMTIKRILRCHPWHPGGNDPVNPDS